MMDWYKTRFNLMSDQAQTPLLNALKSWADRDYAPFHTPGHKRGRGASDRLKTLVHPQTLRADLPELPALDNLFAPEGVIFEAQALAAAAFGADQTWFLANGSTAGVIAAVMAICAPGDTIILPRNVHQSVISGLILSGANPVFVMPEYDAVADIAHGVTVAAIAQALEANPQTKAVLIVSPTYYGVCCDVAVIAQLTQQYAIPLIVDEAHGAHFAFHPDLPMSALAAGADVVIQSTHKTLGALTQASMLHLRGDRVDAARISRSLQLLQSTSPNYLLLASLDAARHQMAIVGKELLSQILSQVETVRLQLRSIPGIEVFEYWGGFDRTRLTVMVANLGISGFTADAILTEQFGVICELPAIRHLTFIFSIGTTIADGDRLVGAMTQLAQQTDASETFASATSLQPALTAITPRDAFFAPHQTVPIAEAVGQITAELICPYPPGIPIVLPGERITPEAVDYLQMVQRSGGFISGCSDPTLQTVRVIIV
jgi:arginine/lysine/ornithine decarboxylase